MGPGNLANATARLGDVALQLQVLGNQKARSFGQSVS